MMKVDINELISRSSVFCQLAMRVLLEKKVPVQSHSMHTISMIQSFMAEIVITSKLSRSNSQYY